MKEKKFHELIKLRKKYKITQREMAVVIDKSRESYVSKENGLTDFWLDEMIKICDYINKKAKEVKDKPIRLDDIFCT